VIRLSVNGEPHEAAVRAEESAVEVLRDRLGLTGTKLVCGEGVCGACTVLLDGVPITSCLLPATALDGREVTTIEGFGPELHPVQRAFIAHDALQCGYCTPGQIMSAVALLREGRAGSDAEIREYMSGNLCRCGAYAGIVAAIREVAAATASEGGGDARL
jgi:xanthine dehydrogenase YagT iron-sulfur-binding subunit